MSEIRIRRSRGVALAGLAVGLVALAAVLVVDFLRRPFVVGLVAVALLSALVALIDRRAKLTISEAGLRSAEWGRRIMPWEEFAGFRWTSWRGQPYVELFPRRPTELVAGFSPLGRFSHALAGWVGMPRFAIATRGLDISEQALAEILGRYLPEQPAG